MSAGKFEIGKYEQATGGNVWPCRAQLETKALTLGGVANEYPSAGATVGLPRVRLRKGKREFGLSIRTVTVKLTADGTGATEEYLEGTLHTVPVFKKSVHDGYVDGAVGTYLGIDCVQVSKFPQV
jgi:hypothetical protein